MAINPVLLDKYVDLWLDEADFVVGCVVEGADVRGEVAARTKGILAGLALAERLARRCDCHVEWIGREGETVEAGAVVCILSGTVRAVMRAEVGVRRVLGRCGAVTALGRRLVDRAGPKCEVRARSYGLEEFWGLRIAGVREEESITLTRNHIKIAGDLGSALKSLKGDYGSLAKIQIHCDNKQEALEAASAGANIIMLCNFKSVDIKTVSKQIKETNPSMLIGVSGWINENNILDYAVDNVDIISSNIFNQGYKFIDFSFNIVNDIKTINIETIKDVKVTLAVEPLNVENKDKANESVDTDSKVVSTTKVSLKRKVDEISSKTEENKITTAVDNSKKDNKKPEEKIQKPNPIKNRLQQKNERPHNKMQRLSSVNKSTSSLYNTKSTSSARMPGYPVSMSTPRAPNGNNLLRAMAAGLSMSFPGNQTNDAFFRGAAPPMRYGSTMGRNGPGAMNSLPDQRNLGSQNYSGNNNSYYRNF